MWQLWAIAIVGLWTIAVPFLGFTTGALTWTLVITGLIVAVLGFWGVSMTAPAGRRPLWFGQQ
jgi:hypothetical protein